MRVAAFALAAASAIACIVVACSSEQETSLREPATCVFPDGTIRTEGVFACPGAEHEYPCRKCSCEEGGFIGSSSYSTNCSDVYGRNPYDAGAGDAAVDGAADAADASADADAGTDADAH